MARHTAKSHKIRKVEILVIQIEICASTSVSLEDGRSAFNALRHSAEQNNLQDLSLNDINTEIQFARNNKA